MAAIGKRVLDLLVAMDVRFHDASFAYLSSRSYQTKDDDSIAANRQYVGLLLQGSDLDYSWVSGDRLGGRSSRTHGTARFVNPDGAYALDYIQEDGLSVERQPITYRIGEFGDDLGAMYTFNLEGRQVRPSEDSFEVHVDLADKSQALDTSIFLDRFQGLGGAVRAYRGYVVRVPNVAALQPATGFYVTVAYRLPSWYSAASDLALSRFASNDSAYVWSIALATAGNVVVTSRTSAGVTVTVNATDLEWVADGRWHQVTAKWDGALLSAFHSTRTGAAKSAVTAAQTTIRPRHASSGWLTGDTSTVLVATHEWVDVAQVALGLDAFVPTDDEILDRMQRPLTEEEGADCQVWIALNEYTGTTSADESGHGNTATIYDATPTPISSWIQTFEGPAELAGTAKPLAFGFAGSNAPITWADQARGEGVVHAGCYKGVVAVFEGAAQRTNVAWTKQKFYGVTFNATTDTISFAARAVPTGVERFDAQPGFYGPLAGATITVAGTVSNNGTFTLVADGTMRTLTVGALANEGPVDCWITVNRPVGAAWVELWHEAGGILFSQVPDLPATAEVLGDVGADLPTDDPIAHWPQYVPAILRRILAGWAGETAIADNWDNGVDEPSDPIGAYYADAGVWLDGTSDRTIRDVLDDGADSIWARYGEDLDAGDWDLYVTGAPPATGGLELTELEILGLRRVKSILPVGGFVLRGAKNYRVLEQGEIAGIAADSDREALARPHLEASARVDRSVATKYPLAEVPEAIETWLRNLADLWIEAQRRYDVLKVEREVYTVEVILYGYGENLLNLRVSLTDADFPTLVAGKDFWAIHWRASDEAVTMTVWG